MTVTRRQAREWAIQMLTAADINPPDDIPAFIALQWEQLGTLEQDFGGPAKAKGKIKSFTEERVVGVLGALGELDKVIASHLDNWDIYRLGTVERAVLRLGVWEIAHSDVPAPVVINEAIDLVNWFSSPKSRTLVNAVLDKFAKSRNGQND